MLSRSGPILPKQGHLVNGSLKSAEGMHGNGFQRGISGVDVADFHGSTVGYGLAPATLPAAATFAIAGSGPAAARGVAERGPAIDVYVDRTGVPGAAILLHSHLATPRPAAFAISFTGRFTLLRRDVCSAIVAIPVALTLPPALSARLAILFLFRTLLGTSRSPFSPLAAVAIAAVRSLVPFGILREHGIAATVAAIDRDLGNLREIAFVVRQEFEAHVTRIFAQRDALPGSLDFDLLNARPAFAVGRDRDIDRS